MEKLKFTYAPRGNQWAVLKWTYLPTGSIGENIQYFLRKEDAKAYAGHLNELDQLFKPIRRVERV